MIFRGAYIRVQKYKNELEGYTLNSKQWLDKRWWQRIKGIVYSWYFSLISKFLKIKNIINEIENVWKNRKIVSHFCMG